MGAPRSVPVALVAGATQAVRVGPGTYRGIVVRETSAAALVLRLWDNDDAASGTLVDIVAVPANGVVSTDVAPVQLSVGLFIERVSGTNYEGSVRLG